MDTDVRSLAEASGSRVNRNPRPQRAPPDLRAPNVTHARRRRARGTFGGTSDQNVNHDLPQRRRVQFGLPRDSQTELAAWPAPDTYETPDSSGPRTKLLAMLLLVAALTAGLVVLAGGGEAFWLCLPGALLVAASAPRRLTAVAKAA